MSAEKMAERATAYIAQQRAQFTDGLSAIHTAHLRLQAALDVAIKERAEARAEVENLYDQIHRLVDDRAKAQSQADRLREQNYELQLERDEARAWAAKLLATLEMVRDADNDCRVEGWATIPDAVRRSIDEALEAKP